MYQGMFEIGLEHCGLKLRKTAKTRRSFDVTNVILWMWEIWQLCHKEQGFFFGKS